MPCSHAARMATRAIPDADSRWLLWLLVTAMCWRHLLAVLTVVPSQDGATYLWMAVQFARGDLLVPVTEVFSPLLPLLVALPVACGMDAFEAGQLTCCILGALAIVPAHRAAELLAPGAGRWAALLMAVAPLPARLCGEVYAEPGFLFAAGTAVVHGLRCEPWRLGLWTAIAFGFRPDALVLALPFLALRPRVLVGALVPVLVAAVGYGWWRDAAGAGFDPVPRISFHASRDDLDGRGDVLANLLQLPVAMLEGLGPVFLLALLGARPPIAPSARRLGAGLVLGLGGPLTFVVRQRFTVNLLPWLLPFAGRALHAMDARWRTVAVLLVLVHAGIEGPRGRIEPSRLADREVGEFVGTQLAPGETLVTEHARISWYAGTRPGSPRKWDAPRLVALAQEPAVGWVVLDRDRADAGAVVAALGPAFARAELPQAVADAAQRRGLLLLRRVSRDGPR